VVAHLAELLCWGAYGLQSRTRLTVLGVTGVAASMLVLPASSHQQ